MNSSLNSFDLRYISLYKILTSVVLFSLLFLSEGRAQSSSLCARIFQQDRSQENLGANFLHDKNSKLHISKSVEKQALRARVAGQMISKPADKISNWLNYLEGVSRKASDKPRALNKVKSIFHRQYVIKPSEVPESYFLQQTLVARERGHGSYVPNAIERRELIKTLIKDQQLSLNSWVEYFISRESDQYPMWVKYWMLTSVVNLSKFDPESGKFNNRSKSTVAPFPELNKEAVAMLVELIMKRLDKKYLIEIQDSNLLQFIQLGNFGHLYGYILKRLGTGQGNFLTNEGQWIVYKQGSTPEALTKSLSGKNTGWCSAVPSTAQHQLNKGDFHVYYSFDSQGNPTVPRLAIRMEGPEISEIRGVAKNQNFDPQISESSVLSEKLKEFGDSAADYQKKSHDMNLLTEIEHKQNVGVPLTKTDLAFLYEINDTIAGFGQSEDPRIRELINKRNIKDDLFIAFDGQYKRDEIATNETEWLSGITKVIYGDFKVQGYKLPDDFIFPEIILGELNIHEISSIKNRKLPTLVHEIDVEHLRIAEDLTFPRILKGGIKFQLLTSVRNVKLSSTLNGDLDLWSLEAAENFELPTSINGSLGLPKIISAQGLTLPHHIKGYLNLEKLSTTEGLKLPEKVDGFVWLTSLKSVKGHSLPKQIHDINDPEYPNIYRGPRDFDVHTTTTSDGRKAWSLKTHLRSLFNKWNEFKD